MPRTRCHVPAALLGILFGSVVLADETPCPSNTYDDNYRFELTYTSAENEEHSVAFVISARSFTVTTFGPRLDFNGRIVQADRDGLVLDYSLHVEKRVVAAEPLQADGSGQANPFRTIHTVRGGLKSNIRLGFGDAMTVFEVGNESARLVVTKVE